MADETGQRAELNREFRALISLVCESIPEFRDYDVRRIAVSLSASKGNGKYGTWAYVVPLRYVGGGLERRGIRWGIPGTYRFRSARIEEREPEAFYLMTFLVPKFFRLSPAERLETIVHEIYHLHPTLRGDLRRFKPPHIHHGPTPALFRAKVKELAALGMANFPALLEHPLLKGSPEDFHGRAKEHLPIPQRVFKPFAGLFGSLALALCLLLPNLAHAVRVVTVRQGNLYASPSGKSEKLDAYERGQSFEALRMSRNKTWVEVQGGGAKGWIPRRWVSVAAQLPPEKSVPGAPDAPKTAVPEDGLGEDGNFRSEGDGAAAPDHNAGLAEIDAASDTLRAARGGKLFEKPNALSERYGLVEKGDELKVQRRSAGGKWAYVRIAATGEEGWYPHPWIVAEKIERMNRYGPYSVEGYLGYMSAGYRFGLGAGFTYNLFPQGFNGRPRDRLEVGLLASYFLGATYVDGEVSASAKYLQVAVIGRYVGASPTGNLAFAGEAGMSMDIASVVNDGLDADVVTQYRLEGGTSFGFLAGAMGLVALSESFQIQAGVRIRVGSALMAGAHGGVAYRF